MNKYEDKEIRGQYRRIIRYLKRWKDINFSAVGNSKPPGIGLTMLAYEKFKPQKYDSLEMKYKFDDMQALKCLLRDVILMFIPTEYSMEENELHYKIECHLPVKPYTDVFCKMSSKSMTKMKKKLEKMLITLEEVEKEVDVIEQCKLLNKLFGADFHIPSVEEESKTQMSFVPPSSISGGKV
ncbi:hypothetical protein [Anoxynatronum buryatiense]|uniref:Uncharacterized protein n=1 Tax=Anoxynatronum buryatiense TaxID=489973 RepID=A0AA45WZ83_9CLOT|nr:hypothetical protein [Anoxynatronum buryatiense]SMP72639.1 hypothetical protein SAMN06296020_1321 [Anoxynatronum buryatiense]